MKAFWNRAKARSFGRILGKSIKKIQAIPDPRIQGRVEQEQPFTILSVILAMLVGKKSQKAIESWVQANYTDISTLYYCLFEFAPNSIGPISQSSISRLLSRVPIEDLNAYVAKLGMGLKLPFYRTL